MIDKLKNIIVEIDTIKNEMDKYQEMVSRIINGNPKDYNITISIEDKTNPAKKSNIGLNDADDDTDVFSNYIKMMGQMYAPLMSKNEDVNVTRDTFEISDVMLTHIFSYLLADRKLKLDTKLKELTEITGSITYQL